MVQHNMKRISVILVTAFVLWAAAGLSSQRPPEKIPKVVMASTSYDFGMVKSGTPLRHTFSFKNEGTDDLRILFVTPG